MARQNATPFDAKVKFEERNPHTLVYFGSHITNKEQAAAALPKGMLRELFLPHFKGPGSSACRQ